MSPDPLTLSLSDHPRSTLSPVPPTSPKAVPALWADRVPMVLGPDALEPLETWERQLHGLEPPSDPGWRPEGPGRSPVDAQPLIDWLRACVERSEPISFNALYLERQGGRSYPYWLETYTGPLNVSRNAYTEAKKRAPRLLLAAIHRDVRSKLRAPPGWSLLVGDYQTCHGWLAHALTEDDALARDLASDIHQVVGDVLEPRVPAHVRRQYGKALNNSMLFGLSPVGLRKLHREFHHVDPGAAWAEQGHAWWWGRYPQLATFRDQVQALVLQAQVENRALHIVAPSGRVSKFSSAELRGKVPKGGKPPKSPEAMWRTVFSAVFRAVEGDLLDRTLAHWHTGGAAHGGRLVLPMYDGVLVAAPEGAVDIVAAALEAVGAHAAAELGVPGLRLVAKP